MIYIKALAVPDGDVNYGEMQGNAQTYNNYLMEMRMYKRFVVSTLALCLLGCAGDGNVGAITSSARPSSADQAPQIKLFTEISDAEGSANDLEQLRRARIEPSKKLSALFKAPANPENLLLSGSRALLDLPGGLTVSILVNGSNILPNGRRSWTGLVADSAGEFRLTLTPSGLVGTLHHFAKSYRVIAIGNGSYIISELDLPPDVNEDVLRTERVNQSYLRGSAVPVSIPTSLLSSTLPTVVDVMVVYTAAADAAIGDISDDIDEAIADANQSYVNSDINLSLNLVHKTQISYTESGGYSTDILRLVGTSDGYLDGVHSLRNTYAADVVFLVTESLDACGAALTVNAIDTEGFAVLKLSCITGNYSLAHELGHIMGARHDLANDASLTPYAYGHGYVGTSGNWRTIMAYPSACGGCSRWNYWSNPALYHPYYTSDVMGTSTYEDDHRVHEERKDVIASFRTSSSLSATISGPSNSGHNVSCSWSISATGGVTPYTTYAWRQYYSASGTYFYVTSGATTSAIQGYALYYLTSPSSTIVPVTGSIRDSHGQWVSATKNVSVLNYYSSCY